MNYYERYCGDYAKKTAQLSLMEHGAYTLLLDEYYSNETALPCDFEALFRICRAMKKEEQNAVRNVAEKFFPIGEDGMRHNARADEMISRARPKMEAARANGAKGGRPRKNPMGYENTNPEETQQKPTGLPVGNPADNPGHNPEETQSETTRAFPNPNPSKPKTISSPSRDDGGPAGFDRFWRTWPATERKVAKAKCAEKWHKAKLESLADEIVSHVEAMRGTRQWREGFEPAPLTYLNQRRWEDGVVADSGINGYADNPFA